MLSPIFVKWYGILNIVEAIVLAPQNKHSHGILLGKAKNLFQKVENKDF